MYEQFLFSTFSFIFIYHRNNSDCLQNILDNGDNNAQQYNRKDPEEVKYAIARITKFPSYTIYEILKPTKAKPRTIPRDTESVFVVKNN